MDLIHRFRELFRGSDVTHGHSALIGKVNDKGKHEARSWTEKGEASDKDWESHLYGKECLGVSPIRSDSTVRWGAIDIDQYNGDLRELNSTIVKHRLPLIVCRSKSGGPHLYLFLSEWVPAKLLVEKLDGLSGFLGYGTSEIFPKQTELGGGDTPESGNWINLPYFGGMENLRYALDEKGSPLKSPEAFCNYAADRRLSREELEKMELPEIEETFPDGPPCLNRIWSLENPQDMRNVALCNAATYLKKARPDDWETALEEVNHKLKEPLPSKEIADIVRSYKKNDYRYMCSKEPLCRYCDASSCKKRKYGISGGAGMPALKSLTKFCSDPPLWFMSVSDVKGNDKRIKLTTEELQTVRLFQRRAMEAINEVPPVIKQDQWAEMLQALFRHLVEIEVADELSAENQLQEVILEFVANRVSNYANRSFNDVIRGLPYEDDEAYYFRYRDMVKYLKDFGYGGLRDNQLIYLLKVGFAGERHSIRIEGKTIALWKIPKVRETREPVLNVPEQEKDPF